MRKKTIKGNTMVVAAPTVTYTTKDGFKAVRRVSEYDGFGEHLILEAVFNLADNNIEGCELAARFGAWLKGEPAPKLGNHLHPYTCTIY